YMTDQRYSTGYQRLDEALGGGLIPGTLTLMLGASGIGKTHLGVSFAAAGLERERSRGVILDLTARGDGQDHAEYAARMHGWIMKKGKVDEALLEPWMDGDGTDLTSIFETERRRVIQGQVSDDQWRDWNAFIQRKIQAAAMFLYSAFVAGRRRVVVDGIEPFDLSGHSAQGEFFEHCVERVIKKDATALAMDAFRERFHQNRKMIAENSYDHRQVASMALVTTRSNMLEELIKAPLAQGDYYAVANTVILAGRVGAGGDYRRALFVAKHRGSACSDSIIPYSIGPKGLLFT
ncbi:MAG: recombinase RecA, partial [Nitrospinota bacterium]|nr:recombinase RecA [Nitrospinota bacterium]